jgi:hypothetical protein
MAGPFMGRTGRVSLPLTGAWTADVVADPASSNSDLPSVGDPMVISIGEGGFNIQGTVARVNNAFGSIFARVVGGNWGLKTSLPAKAYGGAAPVTFGMVLDDILNQCGEELSTSTPGNITNITLPFWTVRAGPGWKALGALIRTARTISGTLVNWRVLPDGTFFVGQETWPQSPLVEFDLLQWVPSEIRATVYAQNPNILPGQSWQSGNVSQIQHDIEPEKVRTTIWFDTVEVS